MSPELRAATNRANSLLSTGPNTAEGKARSRDNALDHGLYSAVFRILDESPTLAADNERTWRRAYKPTTPAADHYTALCAQLDLNYQRISRHLAARIAERQHQAVLDFEEQRSQELYDRVPLWKADPIRAREWFSTRAVGAGWVAQQWSRIRNQLDDRARLSVTAAALAVRLLGSKTGKALKQNPGAWTVRLLTMILSGTARSKSLARMFDDEVQPVSLRSEYTPESTPQWDVALKRLSAVVAAELNHWQELEQRLRAEEHQPGRDLAKALAIVSRDPAEARRERRAEREARNAFDRAWASLQRVLAEDAAQAAGSRNEAGEEPVSDDTSVEESATNVDDTPVPAVAPGVKKTEPEEEWIPCGPIWCRKPKAAAAVSAGVEVGRAVDPRAGRG